MNRRRFLRSLAGGLAAAFVVPTIIVPERRVFALDRTMLNMPPRRTFTDDSAWVQWHIDNGIPVPHGTYNIHAPLQIVGYRDTLLTPFEEGCKFRVHSDKAMVVEDCEAITIDMQSAYFDMRREPRVDYPFVLV